jgi:molybdopterin/thiamine biosynthesis adenylyltransferase
MDTFHRQADILTPEDLEGVDIDLVGAGALGGAILLCLGKMGFGIRNRLTLTDFDCCEAHNLATQWFRPSHVLLKEPKVDALGEMMALVCEREITTVKGRFTGDEPRPVGPVVILAVDSLRERRRIWERLRQRDDVRLLLDARMGAEVLELYSVDLTRDDPAAYAASLRDEGEPFEEPCTRPERGVSPAHRLRLSQLLPGRPRREVMGDVIAGS